jgi:hypothetical protein
MSIPREPHEEEQEPSAKHRPGWVRWAAGVAVAVVAVGGFLGAKALSGNSGASASTSAPSSSATAPGNATGGSGLAAFRTCMSAQGITLQQRSGNPAGGAPSSTTPGATRPAGGFGGGASRFNTPPPGVDAAKYQAALNACSSQLPTGAGAPNPTAGA